MTEEGGVSLNKETRQSLLAPYDVTEERGFLPVKDPHPQVPRVLEGWAEIAYELPKLLVSGRVRKAVDAMPTLSTEELKTADELERAMLAFSYIGHAYVWGDSSPPQVLPAGLAVPWHAIAKKLGRPPVLSYASYALHNWKRLDKKDPIELGNIALLQNFLGGVDEEWFILVHVDIEAKAGPALAALLPAQLAVKDQDAKALQKELTTIESCLSSIYATLLRMTERCDPYIYYHRVRPYIHGWKDHPLFPNGLTYTGVADYDGKPQQFRGETGAQSSIIPSIDAALGVEHANDYMRHYLNEMREYMPPKHSAFIEAVKTGPSIRDFVKEHMNSDKALRDVYDECVHWIEVFRTKHLEYAKNYIFKQHQLSETNPYAVGTGGTPFVPYLEKHRDETKEHMLVQESGT
jgi:indoleamine 2,3-dioxygenase